MRRFIEGRLLIAAPVLSDPNFFRSVIYIARHTEQGAFGILLNRPSNLRLEDVMEQARGHRPKRCDAIYVGGPVEGPLLALHQLENLGDVYPGDVWLTSDDDHLMMLADRPDVPAGFFSGYSGWGPGQLEAELDAGGWMVGEFQTEQLYGDAEQIWELAVKRQGREVLRNLIPDSDKVDPGVN